MQRLGIVLFGANTFDNHKELNDRRFAHSAKELRKVLTDQSINRGRETEVLDIYNKPLLPNDAASRIIDFIGGKDCDDFIVYYCGHGSIGLRDGDYRVLLRQSNRIRRHNSLLHIKGLIQDIQGIPEPKRVYFILDACYSGSAISDMEIMDAGGAETLIDRSLSEAVEGGNGTAVLAASGKLAVAYVKQQDKLTLFTGALVRCLRDGIVHKSNSSTLSWLDIKDEIIRTTRDRLGPDAPIPRLTSFGDEVVDITRVPFFENRAYKPRTAGGDTWVPLDDRTSEHLYWRSITEKSPAYVFEDLLTRYPNGTFAAPARALLARQIDDFDEKKLVEHLFKHPHSFAKGQAVERLITLKWDRLKTGTDIAELERFVEEFPQSEFCGEARRRSILRAEPVETKPVKPPADMVESPRVATLLDNSATSSVDTTPGSATSVGSTAVDQANWLQRFAKQRVGLIGICLVALLLAAIAFQNRNIFRPSLETADQAEKRARELIQANYRQLDAAGVDIVALRSFIDRCKVPNCTLEQEARNRLANAIEADSRAKLAAAAREQLDAAGTDVDKLRSFVDRCKMPSCTLGSEASSRLAAAEAAARLAISETERARLVAAEIERRRAAAAAEADKAERARLAQIVAEQASTFNTYVNYNIQGGDLREGGGTIKGIDPATCLSRCRSVKSCIAFAFDKWSNSCFLKDTVGALVLAPSSDTSIRRDQDSPVFSPNAKQFCPYPDSAAFGEGPPSSTANSSRTCEQNCDRDQSCVGYTFRKTDSQCKLFRVVNDRRDQFASNVTGIRTQLSCAR